MHRRASRLRMPHRGSTSRRMRARLHPHAGTASVARDRGAQVPSCAMHAPQRRCCRDGSCRRARCARAGEGFRTSTLDRRARDRALVGRIAAMHPTLTIAVKAARRAGNVINRGARDLDLLTVTTKGPKDFVSEIDHAAEAAIVKTLLDAYPDHAILAEEGTAKGANAEAENVWI